MKYYVYRITCHHPLSTEKYYYGSRGSTKPPEEDNYWSSSKYVKEAIASFGLEFFTKKIIKTFDTKEESLDLEIRLHEKLSVDTHEKFFNRCKQSKWGYNCTGTVVKGKTYEEILGVERATALRQLRSINAKGKDNRGTKNPMFGKKHSAEMKAKLSNDRIGSLHPTFGWKWITNGIESKKIDPNETSIPDGWKYGRVFKGNRKNDTHYLA